MGSSGSLSSSCLFQVCLNQITASASTKITANSITSGLLDLLRVKSQVPTLLLTASMKGIDLRRLLEVRVCWKQEGEAVMEDYGILQTWGFSLCASILAWSIGKLCVCVRERKREKEKRDTSGEMETNQACSFFSWETWHLPHHCMKNWKTGSRDFTRGNFYQNTPPTHTHTQFK